MPPSDEAAGATDLTPANHTNDHFISPTDDQLKQWTRVFKRAASNLEEGFTGALNVFERTRNCGASKEQSIEAAKATMSVYCRLNIDQLGTIPSLPKNFVEEYSGGTDDEWSDTESVSDEDEGVDNTDAHAMIDGDGGDSDVLSDSGSDSSTDQDGPRALFIKARKLYMKQSDSVSKKWDAIDWDRFMQEVDEEARQQQQTE